MIDLVLKKHNNNFVDVDPPLSNKKELLNESVY